MAKRGENSYKRKDGRWEGRYIIGRQTDGKPQFRSVYTQTYAQLREKLTLCKSYELQYGRQSAPLPRVRDEPFADWARYWLQSIAKPAIRAGTYRNYRSITENHLIPAPGETRLWSVSHVQRQTLVCGMQVRLSSGTVQGAIRALKHILNRAQCAASAAKRTCCACTAGCASASCVD